MSRLTNENANTDVDNTKRQNTAPDKARPQGPASEESFGCQANKGILAEHVGQELSVPRRTAARVLDAVLDSIRDLLHSRGKVAVKGFGTFERRIRKGRAYKHPLTGASIDVANKETVVFKPSDALIESTRTGAKPRNRSRSQGKTPDEILFKG